MKKKLNKWQITFLLFLVVGTLYVLNNQPPYHRAQGIIYGTFYHITYQNKYDLSTEIKDRLLEVDAAFSMYNDTSLISRINRNDSILVTPLFKHIFNLSERIAQETDGAFDITVAPLVNTWGFGFKKNIAIDSATIDSIRPFIGYQKVRLVNNMVTKENPHIMLDCSAIAKGYGSDRVAELFDEEGIKNYMIEIGGEIVVKGMNPQKKKWMIGINKPVDDSLNVNNTLETIISISNRSIATSGNYRKFYYLNGKKYAHTIDPRTGYPVQHSLLSATVITKYCAEADAYATSFMVMGLEKAIQFIDNHKGIDAYFIYGDHDGNLKTYYSKGMDKYKTKEQD
ncbi:MAG: FAD:protein FMN transferase [Bacteroidaceae bacterium]|nr:FAD:protein FMN transferase [Bacteroidaceae bacterium]